MARTALDETSVKGEFKRIEAGFRNVIEKGGQFEPEGKLFNLKLNSNLNSIKISFIYILCLSLGQSMPCYTIFKSNHQLKFIIKF